jgi:hypothetical protein
VRDHAVDADLGHLRSADGRWKAPLTEPPIGPDGGHWELFDLNVDRGENDDVSVTNPDVLTGPLSEWSSYMTGVGGVKPLRPRGHC